MTIPKQVDKLDDVPEALREFYVESKDSDGVTTFDLATDEATRISEFRTRNVKVMKENKELADRIKRQDQQLQSFDGIDPDRYKRATQALELIEGDEERKLVEEGKIDEVVQRRMKTAINAHGEQVTALTTARDTALQERDALRTTVDRTSLRSAVQSAIDGADIRLRGPGALHDIHARIAGDFVIDRETGHPKARDGQFGPKGDPQTIADKLVALAGSAEASHLFEPAGGSGSTGGRRDPTERGRRVIDPNDPVAIGRNLDAIHKGTMVIGKG